jgi:hypothetical protein
MLRSREEATADKLRSFEPKFFEHSMEELSRVQLGLEQCSQLVQARETLFTTDRQARLIVLIRYPDKYLRKVVQEFEYRRFGWTENKYVISENCSYFTDFLGRSSYRAPIEPQLKELEAESGEGDDSEGITPPQREAPQAEYLKLLEFIKKPGDRSRSVAAQCLRLCLRELRGALRDV